MIRITRTMQKFVAVFLTSAAMITSAQADVVNIKGALAIALKNKTIAAAGEQMKLFSLSANYNGANKIWSFQFYDGGAHLHSCSVDKSGKVRYYARDKGSMRIFDDVDFTKLPAPNEVFIDDLVGKGKAALAALKFKTLDNGKLYVNYYVRSEFSQKDKAYHSWSVTIPIGDGKQGKKVSFKNGDVYEIRNSTIYGG